MDAVRMRKDGVVLVLIACLTSVCKGKVEGGVRAWERRWGWVVVEWKKFVMINSGVF